MSVHHARVEVRPGWTMGMSPLTSESLVEALGGVVVQRLEAMSHGGYDADLLLSGRSGHQAVLEELASVASQFGFVYVKAVIVEYVSTATEMAVSGALGGGAIGGHASKNPFVALLAAGAGALAGAAVGQFVQIEKNRYEATWQPHINGWQVTQLALPSVPQVRFGTA